MSVKDSAYRVAHRYPGGVAALAVRMGINVNTLQHKVNPNSPGHHLYIEDAELMTALSGDAEIAQALALACNHVCIPVPPALGSAAELARQIAATGKEFGDVMRATLDAIADNRVTLRELAAFDEQFHQLLAAAVALRAELLRLMPVAPAIKAVK